MRAIIVIEVDVPTPEDLPDVITAINPPKLPHFAGKLRVCIDPVATELLAWLDE